MSRAKPAVIRPDRLANLNMKRQAKYGRAMAKKTDLIVAVSQYSKGKNDQVLPA
jgi:hypothetical protein